MTPPSSRPITPPRRRNRKPLPVTSPTATSPHINPYFPKTPHVQHMDIALALETAASLESTTPTYSEPPLALLSMLNGPSPSNPSSSPPTFRRPTITMPIHTFPSPISASIDTILPTTRHQWVEGATSLFTKDGLGVFDYPYTRPFTWDDVTSPMSSDDNESSWSSLHRVLFPHTDTEWIQTLQTLHARKLHLEDIIPHSDLLQMHPDHWNCETLCPMDVMPKPPASVLTELARCQQVTFAKRKLGRPRKPDAVKRVKVDGEVIVDKPNPEIPVSCDIVIELDTVPSLTQCAEDTRLSSKPSTRSADKITAVKPVRVSTPRDEDTVSIAKTGRKDRRLVAPMDMVTRSAGKVVEMPPLPRVRTSSYGLRQNVGPGITARLFKTPRREGVKVGLTVGKSFGMELGKSVFEKPAPTVETSVKVFEKPTKMVETLPSTHLQPLRSTIHPDPFDHPKRRGRHSTIDTTDETLPPINDVTILPKRPRGRPRKTPVVPSSPVTTHTATSFSPGMMEAPPSPPSSPPEFVEEVGKLERRKERLLSPGEEGRDACGNGKGMGREVTGMVTRSAGRIPLKRRRMVVEDDDDVDGVEIIL